MSDDLSDVPFEYHQPTTQEEIDDIDVPEEEKLAYRIAAWVMHEFKPGFVIIGSPVTGVTDSGIPYPDSVGLIINVKTGMTPTSLAVVLDNLSSQLNGDIEKVENFLREATGNE